MQLIKGPKENHFTQKRYTLTICYNDILLYIKISHEISIIKKLTIRFTEKPKKFFRKLINRETGILTMLLSITIGFKTAPF